MGLIPGIIPAATHFDNFAVYEQSTTIILQYYINATSFDSMWYKVIIFEF